MSNENVSYSANAASAGGGAQSYNCPSCGAELYFNADKQKFACEFCESEFTSEEISSEASNEAAEKRETENCFFSCFFAENMLEYF